MGRTIFDAWHTSSDMFIDLEHMISLKSGEVYVWYPGLIVAWAGAMIYRVAGQGCIKIRSDHITSLPATPG